MKICGSFSAALGAAIGVGTAIAVALGDVGVGVGVGAAIFFAMTVASRRKDGDTQR